jgi:hypothetical protein
MCARQATLIIGEGLDGLDVHLVNEATVAIDARLEPRDFMRVRRTRTQCLRGANQRRKLGAGSERQTFGMLGSLC